MSSESHPQAIEARLEQLETRLLQMRGRCRRLMYALAAVAAVAIGTPAYLLTRTSFGSVLSVHTVSADRILLREGGELVLQGESRQPRARLGYFADDGWFGLAFFDGKQEVVRFDGGRRPSLTFNKDVNHSKTQLRLGYAGSKGPNVPELSLENGPMVEIVGYEGRRQVSLIAADNGDPHLIFWDSEGKQRYVDLTTSLAWSSRMTLWYPGTKQGQSRLQLDHDALTLYDKEGKRRARLRMIRGEPEFLLLDENEQPMPRK